MAANKGDKKARQATAKKSDRPSRRPKQKGKIKKAQNTRPKVAFFMRSELPADMKREAEANRLQDNDVPTKVAKNVAAWRAQRNLL